MPVLESDVKAAQDSQKEYWNRLVKNLDFFNKTEITNERIDFIREHIHCYNGYYNHFLDKSESALKTNRLYFSHFWLSNYLQYAVMSCWNDYFNFNRFRGLKERDYVKIADQEAAFFKDYLVSLFP